MSPVFALPQPPLPEHPDARGRLEEARAGTLARIASLDREYEGIVEANALVAVDDEHDPEGASTAFERAHVASLLAAAHAHLDELDRAVQRLEGGDDYGVCVRCHEPIAEARLEVRPAATTCVGCATVRTGRR
ncbi:TraR/DksA C4-type zinc finger protein [uncultured Streptomyces sp.]|uniref:TraR/DksA family transcriptional regulator n=1 Tax=uncultured Streptomyces sp. TaxID=174707 RepID=UPI00260551DC|nr:TraR/DksA C4-type zinc finger protein [uncultured Streptomyces sp.]